MSAADGQAAVSQELGRRDGPARETCHVIPYADFMLGGLTDCCGRLVGELPESDVCVPPGDHEPGTTRCTGGSR